MDIATRRLRSQRLAGNPLETADEVVGWLGAVQAQDYPAAVWALGQRTRDATAADVHRLFDAGTIVRTHVLRPTWHFALAADVRWLLALTAPRLRTALAGRWRELGIDPGVMRSAQDAFADALAGGRQLTRTELGAVLQAAGIAPDGQRLPHLILAAELDALVVSGPRRGHDFTHMLMDDRVPAAAPLSPEEALGRLAERYFRSRGPAQLQDPASDAIAAAAAAAASAAPAPGPPPPRTSRVPVAHLLPNFDELTVAYRDRSAADHPEGRFDPDLFAFGSILSNVLVIGGRVRGAWHRVVRPRSARVQVRLLDPLRPAERAAVDRAADRMSRFLERPVEIEWEGPRAGW